jgi:hypothetical protein
MKAKDFIVVGRPTLAKITKHPSAHKEPRPASLDETPAEAAGPR